MRGEMWRNRNEMMKSTSAEEDVCLEASSPGVDCSSEEGPLNMMDGRVINYSDLSCAEPLIFINALLMEGPPGGG